MPRAGQPPASLIFVAIDVVSIVPLPSKSAWIERTSHTGNPRPRSTGAAIVGVVEGVGDRVTSVSPVPPGVSVDSNAWFK